MGAVGWCLEPHDLAVSKLAAGREKDVAFVGTMLHARLISPDLVRQRISQTSAIQPGHVDVMQARLSAALALP